MEFIKVILVLVAMLSVLVIAHEWGHFIVARILKIRVDDFSIGFGPRLVRLGKLGDTEYNLRAFPLGGFVKIAGMSADEEPLIKAKDSLTGKVSNQPVEIQNGDISDSTLFFSRPIWQRSLVILAGPVMSLIFGIMVFCLAGCTVGAPGDTVTTRIATVNPGGTAYQIGLRAGDTIESINNQPIRDSDALINVIELNYGKQLNIVVQRGADKLTFTGVPRQARNDDGTPVYAQTILQPKVLASAGFQAGDTISAVADTPVSSASVLYKSLKDSVGQKTKLQYWRNNTAETATINLTSSQLSNLPTVKDFPVGVLRISLLFSTVHVPFKQSVAMGLQFTQEVFANLAQLFQKHQGKRLSESTGGVVTMYNMTGLAMKMGLSEVVLFAGEISISLAIFNILPIPVLDGGHLLSYFIEAMSRGKKMNDKQQQAFLLTGVAVIGTLFVIIFTNDIHKLITHQMPQ